MKVAIVSGICVRHDAISNAVLHERVVLHRAGHEVTVFCQATDHDDDPGIVAGLNVWQMYLDERFAAADLVVLHFGTGYELFDVLQLSARGATRVVRFHNVTPPELLEGPHRRRALTGLDQVVAAERADHVWCDSEFNRRTLHDLGTDPATTSVLELCVPEVDGLSTSPLAPLPDGPPTILYVGRFVAAKGVDDLLEAYLRSGLADDGVRLVLAGNTRLSDPATVARITAAAAGCPTIEVLDEPSDEDLMAQYRTAAVFAMPSHHEGFCVPVVEAMAAGVPVVASARAALPDTVGDAGVLVDDPDDPVLTAALLHRVVTDDELRHALVGRGASRARSMAAPVSLPKLVDAIRWAAADPAGRRR